ncbi:MAG: SusD/RagB family nutrient-binding outer membrane lipoprotein [Bacteroidetes bacterium]|jgi:hypothetical protein|nr:SusD/RagB family nutrient-binding outer membrane lipoprotein [Bacteroidota bacterium]
MMTTLSRITLCAAIGLMVLVSACDFSDLNEDPNSPTRVTDPLQLSALLASFSYEVVGNEPARTPSLWMQQLAANAQPLTEDNYDLTSTDVNNLWEFTSYPNVMNNARDLDRRASESGNTAYAAIAKTVYAFNLGVVTDLWGDVPLSEAFDPLNTQPAYDAQEAVYAAIFDLLDQALADFGASSVQTPGGDDLLYGGDLQKWERLAHTLLARFHMRLTNAPGNNAADRAQQALDALQNGFQSNADDADFQYFDEVGAENPWYQFTIDGKWVFSRQLSKQYVDLLKTRQDPRLAVQARQAGAVTASGVDSDFTPAPITPVVFDLDDSTYVGHANGTSGTQIEDISSIGVFYSAPGAALTWISYAEAKFLEAEATLITQGAAAADPIYREAITASMDKLGIDPADRADYLANRPTLTAGTALEAIITEKYIANFLSLETFNDWRRTGFPALTPVTNRPQTPNGRIPVRYPYPQSELSTNSASVEATGVPAGFAALETPVWWDAN